jgi:hypothetical protein
MIKSIVSYCKLVPPSLSAILFLILSVLYISSIHRITTWLNPPTGDEPYYLMTAISLLEDGDIIETNNFKDKDYLEFSPSCRILKKRKWGELLSKPGVLAPGLRKCRGKEHFSVPLIPHSTNVKGKVISKHGIGLSLLLAPLWYIGGRYVILVAYAILTALLGVAVFNLSKLYCKNTKITFFIVLSVMASLPIFSYSHLIFPAIPAAYCTFFCYSILVVGIKNKIDISKNKLLTQKKLHLCAFWSTTSCFASATYSISNYFTSITDSLFFLLLL